MLAVHAALHRDTRPLRDRVPARSIVVLVVLAFVPAACGGGNDTQSSAGGPTTTVAPTTVAPTTVTAVVSAAADKATARTLLLRSSDLPDGWRATPYRKGLDEKLADDKLAACTGRPKPDTYATADIYSPVFVMGNAEASSEALLVRTVEDFQADATAVAGPKFFRCVKDILSKFIFRQSQGVSVKSIVIEPIQVARYGEFSMGFRTTVKATSQGRSRTFYLDTVLLGKGRIELSASFSNVGRPFDPTLRRALLAKLGARLASA
jgi:hypothetical protein